MPLPAIANTSFQSIQELVSKFNDEQTTPDDKKYLKTIIGYVLLVYKQQQLKTESLVNEFTGLALSKDQDIYTTTVNLLAKEVSKLEVVYNSYALKALTQAVWLNETQKLNTQQLERLIDIVNQKTELTVSSLTLFGDLLDAMVKAGTAGFSKQKLTALQDKLTGLLDKANHLPEETVEKEELRYRIAYVYQASLRIGSDESKAQMIKRKLIAFLAGVKEVGIAASSIAGAVVTFGATAPFTIAGSIDNLVKSAGYFQKAFHLRKKKNWYNELLELQAAIVLAACKQDEYDLEDTNDLIQAFSPLTNKKPNKHIKYGIIDTLVELIKHHKANAVKDVCLNIIKIYAETDESLKNKVLQTLAEVANHDSLAAKVKKTIERLKMQTEYDAVKNQLNQLQLKQPEDSLINLVEVAQKAANEALESGKAKGVIEAIFFEDGSIVDSCKFENCEVVGLEAKVSEQASEDERKRMSDVLAQIQDAASKIRAVMVEKGAKLTNTTVTNSRVVGTQVVNSAEAIGKEWDKRTSADSSSASTLTEGIVAISERNQSLKKK